MIEKFYQLKLEKLFNHSIDQKKLLRKYRIKSEKSKTSKACILIANLTNKIDIQGGEKSVAL